VTVLSWTVLGGSPAWPNPGQAASGYLLESEERRILIDCGSGIAQELRALDPPPLTDILITHWHADHWFDLVEYDPHSDLRIGDLLLTFAPCLHYTTCYSVKISAPNKVIVFSADTAPTERLARFAHGADLFVCEAALRDASNDSSERGHMDAAEAGREAARAGAKRLLLTHIPEEIGYDFVRERAAQQYGGPIDLATPGLRIDI